MNEFSPWMAILAVAVIFALVMISVISHQARERDLFRFAQEWKGKILPRGLFSSSAVKLWLDEHAATLEYTQNDDEPTQTHLTIALPAIRLRLELKPQNTLRALGKYFGMQDIEIGSPDFDEAFVIQGSDQPRIKEFLTGNVQTALLYLAHCGTGQRFDLHVVLSAGVLRITKHEQLASLEQLSRFATCCRDLLRMIQKAQAAGIEFVAQAAPQLVQDTQCQVCGDPLTGKVVFCAKCKTPHHLDCWEYFGSCAIYGCGQRKFLPAKRA